MSTARLLRVIAANYAPGTCLHYEVRSPRGERARWVMVTYSERHGLVVPASKGGKMLEVGEPLVVGDSSMSPATLLHLAGFTLEED